MKAKMINKVSLEGYVYEHSLAIKESGPNSKKPGTKYIAGAINIATDDDCLNIVPVNYTYVTETTANGGANRTYQVLAGLIDESIGTVMKHGKEKAGKVRVDTSIALNEFYSDRNGTEELVSVKRNEGGFIHLTDTLSDNPLMRNMFECDIVITNVTRKEADEEKEMPEKVIIKGGIFDFRKALLPVEFVATHPGAMDYFESLEASASNPTFTKIRGQQISQTIVTTVTEESAFGDASVREVRRSRKEYLVNWANPETYEWDTEGTITADELKKAMADRETHLATLKTQREQYKASQAASASAVAQPASTDFKF